jgi:hypothetical protein
MWKKSLLVDSSIMRIGMTLLKLIVACAIVVLGGIAPSLAASMFQSISNHPDGNYSYERRRSSSTNVGDESEENTESAEIQSRVVSPPVTETKTEVATEVKDEIKPEVTPAIAKTKKNKATEEIKTVEKKLEVVPLEAKKEEASAEEIKFAESHQYRSLQVAFSIAASFLEIHGVQTSNDSKGVLNSEFYPTYRGSLLYYYNQWRFVLQAGYRSITFQNSNERVLWNERQSMLNYDLFVARSFGRFGFGVGVGQEGRIFYRSLTSSDVDVEKRTEKRVWISPEYLIYKGDTNLVWSALRFGINPSQDTQVYNVERGYFYSGIFKYDHYYAPTKRVGLELFYKRNKYSTEELKLNSTEIGLGVSFNFELGAEK